jgi:hypothetical protein
MRARPFDRQQLVEAASARTPLEDILTLLGEGGLDRALDDLVATTRDKVAAAAAEEIAVDLKNPAGHRRVEGPSLPASGQGLPAATRTGPTPAGRNRNV